MSRDLAADRRARRVAQTVFDRPLLLEAGAGTGKTTTLVARVLSWCVGPGWDRGHTEAETDEPHKIAATVLQGVVAITFTEAAAAEMAARIAEALAMVVDGREGEIKGYEPPSGSAGQTQQRQQRAEALLETFDHLTVSTIHAFCFGLLTDYPLEAGLHPDLRVDADGSELEAVARNAVEQWTQQAYSEAQDSPFLTLAEHAIGPGQILEAVTRWLAIGAPVGLLAEDPLSSESVTAFVDGLEESVGSLLTMLAERFASLPAGRVALGVREGLGETAALLSRRPELPELIASLSANWPDNRLGKLKKWGRGEFTGEEASDLGELAVQVEPLAARLREELRRAGRIDAGLLAAARQALLPVARQIERDLRARGVITFSGLLRETQQLLRSSTSVLQRVRQRLALLLVDEFQDTDPVQSEIVRRLALEGNAEDCPSLFVVGDPKQSIYGWRDADLAAYEAFEQVLLDRGGERHTLTVNFRSAQEILDEVERAVSPVMRPLPGLQPPFHGLRAASGQSKAQPFRQGHWREIEYWVSWRPDPVSTELGPGSHGEARRVEAREVAEDIRKLHDQAGVAWSDVAILFRKTAPQPTFLDELRRLGVPFAINRDRNYYQRREVIDAAAWIRAIINPADHLALLTALRSVVAGVPDAALIPLWTRSFPQLVTELRAPDKEQLARLREVVDDASAAVPSDAPGIDRVDGWQESLMSALASLARLRRDYRRDTADLFIDKVKRELLVEASEAARFQGKFRLANLQRFFGQLEVAMESDEADVHAILRALRLGIVQAREAEQAVPRDAVEEAVQVMTIHTAKGLEFSHVYLVQMHSGTRGGGNELLAAREVAPDDWEYQLFGASTLTFHRAEERLQGIESAEAVRTLYVALTRASQRLVLVGSWPVEPAPGERDSTANYIEMLRHRDGLPESLAELANNPALQLRGGYHDQDGIRWRFLGGARSLGAQRPEPEEADWLPTVERLRISAETQRSRQIEVDARSARTLQEPVTAGISDRIEEQALSLESAESGAGSGHERRRAAQALGTAVHRCLETWDLEAPVDTELARQRRRLPTYFADDPEPAVLDEASMRLDRLAESNLLVRLRDLRGHILGRELPLIATPDSTPDNSGPVGSLVGSIDLLYSDPVTSELVVVDFKTDRVESDEEIAGRAAVYSLQEQRYARAVQEALDLDQPPRTELWLLWPDRVWSQDGVHD